MMIADQAAPSGAPFDPSLLAAVVVTETRVDLTWQDNSANELLFRIQRSVAGGPWADLDTVLADVTSYSDTAAPTNQFAQYRVRAENAAGNSGYNTGNTVCVAVTPAQVTGLTANALSTSAISLAWSIPSGTVTKYEVRRDGVVVATVTTNSFTDTGLSTTTSYDYDIRAGSDCGFGAWSSVVSETTFDLPVGAEQPTLTAAVAASTKIDASWDNVVTNAQFYELQWDTEPTFASPDSTIVPIGIGFSHLIQALVAETDYHVRVRGGSNNPAVGTWSNVVSLTTWAALLNNFTAVQNGASCPDAVADLSVATGGRTDNWIVQREDSVSGWTQILDTPFGPGATATFQDTGAKHIAAGDSENTLQYRTRASGEDPNAWVTISFTYDCLP